MTSGPTGNTNKVTVITKDTSVHDDQKNLNKILNNKLSDTNYISEGELPILFQTNRTKQHNVHQRLFSKQVRGYLSKPTAIKPRAWLQHKEHPHLFSKQVEGLNKLTKIKLRFDYRDK